MKAQTPRRTRKSVEQSNENISRTLKVSRKENGKVIGESKK